MSESVTTDNTAEAAHRRTWLAATGDELESQAWAKQQLQQLRDDPDVDPLLSLACVFASAAGPDESVLIHALASLRVGDVTRQSLAIASFAATAFDCTRARYRLELPTFAQKRFWQWRRGRGDEAQWLVELGVEAPDERLRAVRERLRQAYSAWARQAPQQRGAGKAGQWRMLIHAARMLLLERGLPSLWLTPLAQLPLPVSSANELWVSKEGPGAEALGRVDALMARGPGRRASAGPPPEPVPVAEDLPDVGERNALLVQAVRAALTQFRQRFFELSLWREHGVKNGAVARLDEIVELTIERLRAVERGATSLAIASVLWAHEMALHGKLKRTTVLSYTRLVSARRHMYSVYAVDVTDWESDTADDILDELMGFNPKAATLRRSSIIWGQFGRWLFDNDWLDEPFEISAVAARRGVSLHRTQIARPANFDEVLNYILTETVPAPAQDQDSMGFAGAKAQVLALAMGYYGGLRAGEVGQLTLADVLVEPAEPSCDLGALIHDPGTFPDDTQPLNEANAVVYLIIRRGKTPAARRRLPLHVLWPPKYTGLLMEYLAERSETLSRQRPDRQALFGPPGDERHFHRDALITPAIERLRESLGSGVDFHALRHAAATYWMLRVHAEQFSEFRASLNDQEHWLFHSGEPERFLETLCAPGAERAFLQGLQYQALARLIGHSSVETTIRTYAHSIGMLHGQWLKRTFSNHRST